VGNRDLKLKPGMTANVSIMIAHREGVLKIPNGALRFRPEFAKRESGKGGPSQKVGQRLGDKGNTIQGEQGRPGRVWVLSSEGRPIPVFIVLGITDGTNSEVISGELREGGEVIIEEALNKKVQSQTGAPPFMGGMRK